MSSGTRLRQRNRDVTIPVKPGYKLNPFSGNWDPIGVADTKIVYTGTQVTESEGHRKSRFGKYYEGGPFFSACISYDIPTRHIEAYWSAPDGRDVKYSGPINTPVPNIKWGGKSIPSLDSSYLDPVGAEAISFIDPTNPHSEFGAALGEIIKDRKLPTPVIQAWKRRTEAAKAAGSEYLNAVFGWLPLVSDMESTAQAVKDGNTILENYRNHSGTKVYREFEFPASESEATTIVQENTHAEYNPFVSFGQIANANDQTVTKYSKSTTRRWFSGSFTYAASNATSVGRMLGIGSEADKLLGLSLSPDVVWELTPWSWAIDWFSNSSNVISNASSLGLAGLVMQYAYIMEETSIVDTYSMPGTGLHGVGGTVPPASITYTVKRRREANPFGFGLTWDGLDPTQLSILSALGITRLR
jgi:hypothetical protein